MRERGWSGVREGDASSRADITSFLSMGLQIEMIFLNSYNLCHYYHLMLIFLLDICIHSK